MFWMVLFKSTGWDEDKSLWTARALSHVNSILEVRFGGYTFWFIVIDFVLWEKQMNANSPRLLLKFCFRQFWNKTKDFSSIREQTLLSELLTELSQPPGVYPNQYQLDFQFCFFCCYQTDTCPLNGNMLLNILQFMLNSQNVLKSNSTLLNKLTIFKYN